MVTDPVADMFTRIRNANKALKENVDIPASNFKEELVKTLLSEGYIKNYRRLDDRKQGVLRVFMKYPSPRVKSIKGIKVVSRPGLKKYVTHDRIPRIMGGLGIAIISTSKGLMTDREARRNRVGGKVIAYIW